jgi:hypothetical protein
MAKLDEADRDKLDDGRYAFAKQRKEPIEDAAHVRNAIARFNRVKDVTDAEREADRRGGGRVWRRGQ